MNFLAWLLIRVVYTTDWRVPPKNCKIVHSHIIHLVKRLTVSNLSSMPVTITTMQPTFLPWLGYFALIQSVDVFVLLDDVQFCNRSFHSRNKIKTSQGPLFLTVPCRKGRRPICDVEVVNPSIYDKLMRSISQSYAKAPFRDEIIRILDPVFLEKHRMLVDLNCALISEITASLNLNTSLLKSSELNVPRFEKHLRLLHFCKKLNANEYLSVPGSMSYLKDNNPFPSSDIRLKLFSFEHPVYPQLHGAFEPYLSIIDAIANIGSERTNRLLQASVGPKLDFNQAAGKMLN